jgi:protein MBA1
MIAFGTNTMMVAQFRLRSKLKPNFGQMKSLAIQRYVEVNQKFAVGDLNAIRPYVSSFVMRPLSERLNSIPSDVKHSWKLVKFNSTPKAMSVLPMMLPGTPLAHIMVVYRIESRQRLAKLKRGQTEPEVVERDVVDYPAFVFDVSRKPYETVLVGSLFESKCS